MSQDANDKTTGYFAKYISSASTGWLSIRLGGKNERLYTEDCNCAFKFETEDEANTAIHMWHNAQTDDQLLSGEWRVVQDRDAPFAPDAEDFCFAGGAGMTPEEVWDGIRGTMTYEQLQKIVIDAQNGAIDRCAEKVKLLGEDYVSVELLKFKR